MATFTNKFVVIANRRVTRIVFSDQRNDEPPLEVGEMVLTSEDARQLEDVLRQVRTEQEVKA